MRVLRQYSSSGNFHRKKETPIYTVHNIIYLLFYDKFLFIHHFIHSTKELWLYARALIYWLLIGRKEKQTIKKRKSNKQAAIDSKVNWICVYLYKMVHASLSFPIVAFTFYRGMCCTHMWDTWCVCLDIMRVTLEVSKYKRKI